jgi:cobalt-zinc-cadmium resistance protein CzcA
MALTVIFALSASLILSLTLMPVLASMGLPRKVSERETLVDRVAHRLFQPILGLGLAFARMTLASVAAITVIGTVLGFRLGSEFIPRLNEGSVVINAIRLASVSLEESLRYGIAIENYLKKRFPDEIGDIWTRTGSAEVATDPMGLELSDIFITLKGREHWAKAKTQEELVSQMSRATKVLPGMRAVYTQPIEMRINEMVAGIRSDLGVKLYGDDLETLKAKAAEIELVLKGIRGAADTTTEQVTGLPVVRIVVDNEALSRHGVPADSVLDVIKAAGGIAVGEVIEPGRRFPLVVRLPFDYREDVNALDSVFIPTPDGQRLPLSLLARLEETTGPSTIQRDWGERRIIVQTNVRGRDIASFVAEAQARIASEVKLPTGYHIEWGGQFEHLERAQERLFIVVPLALVLILSLLYLTFRSVRDALMIFSGVLFARVGGVVGLLVMGLPFTISAGVGFVALAGASMLEGLVLVSAIRDRMARGMPKREAIEDARLTRLRPVLMTGTVAALGFVPMMLSTGIGSEVQRPLATVVVFGLAFDTVLSLLSLPALYLLFGKGPRAEAAESADDGPEDVEAQDSRTAQEAFA